MSRGRNLRQLGAIVIAAAFLFVSAGSAQSVSQGTITGTVMLPTGERAPGVTLTIKSPSLVTGERIVVSDSDGRFVFLSLPPGTYELNASLSGFRGYSAPGIALNSGAKRDVTVTMQPGSFDESIVVTSAAPIIDTRTSVIDTNFTAELLESLPTARDAFYDLAVTAPGISSVGSDESWLRSPSAFGSSASENMFLVNGVNATNPRGAPWGSLVSVNYNTVEEVKILSLGSKAEYGSFSGVAIDVLTKSGSNEFTGDVAYYSLVGNASDNSTLEFGDELFYANPNDVLTTIPESSSEVSITFGGPVVRDRAWFYGGFATTDAETDTPLFEPLSLWESSIYDLKVTGEFGGNHRAWLSYHMEDLESGNTTWGQTWDATMVYNSPTDNDTIQAQYQWVITDRDIGSFKYLGFNTEQNPTIPNTTGHPGFINWWKYTGGQSIGLGGDFPYVEAQKSERQTLQADYTHYAADFMGEHELKFGVQYTRSEGNWQGGYFHGYANFAYPYPYQIDSLAKDFWWNCSYDWCWGTDEDPIVPFYNNKTFRNPWLTVRQAGSTGAFIDDTWTPSDRLTFDIGLRFDTQFAKYGEGAVYEMPNSPQDINNPVLLRTREGTGNIFDFDTWSPRLGMAWTMTDDRKTVLRAHVGRYYAPMGVESLRRFGPDMEPALREHWRYMIPLSEIDLNGNGKVDFDEIRPATRLLVGRTPDMLLSSNINDPSWALEVEPGTDNPHTDQFHVSVARQIGNNLSVELGYILKETNDLLALRPFDTTTGEYWNWVERPFTTFTGYQSSVWEIERKDYTGDGVFDIADARYILQNTGYRAVNMGSFAGQKAERVYHGLQLVFTRRHADRWQGLASVNWNDSDGIAPRTVDQNWYIDGPMVMDTPFGSTFNHFQNNLEGPLPMTPEWMVKISGSYTLPVIETNLGLRYRYDSGRAFFPVQQLSTFQSWMGDLNSNPLMGTGSHEFMVADDPNNADFTPPTSIVDLSLSKTFSIGGSYGLNLSLDVLNALNEDAPNRVGFHDGDYGRVYGIVQPRIYRAGVKLQF
ncbi:MAG TPA: carboxypeptidase regulatory-like domain-containing protein [Thermoanaerobaculia bacterium]|nr:carboxypeptidase regulatory-like domain-containing protein [Thermoanaerobaculia bacterium]